MWIRCLRSTISQVKNFKECSSKIHVSSCLLIPNPCLFLIKVRSIYSSSPSVSSISSLSNEDLVITLLDSYGCTKPFISNIITKYPPILSSDSHKTLKPNIDFFISKGLSGLELAKFISSNPNLLKRNLQNHIIPPFNVLKIILQSDKNVITTLKRQSREFLNSKIGIEKMMVNIELLRNQGVPQSNISKFLINQPRALTIKTSKFKEIVEEIKGMGFDPYKTTYLLAIEVINGLSKSNRESRMDVYRRLGWSEEQILKAFMYYPLCMLTSDKKITSVMDYLVNQMGYSLSYIAQHPIILCYSLEKRIIPGCSVYKILTSKGLVKKKNPLCSLLPMSEKSFLEKFVIKFEVEAPELLKLYPNAVKSRAT